MRILDPNKSKPDINPYTDKFWGERVIISILLSITTRSIEKIKFWLKCSSNEAHLTQFSQKLMNKNYY